MGQCFLVPDSVAIQIFCASQFVIGSSEAGNMEDSERLLHLRCVMNRFAEIAECATVCYVFSALYCLFVPITHAFP
jgi:hypothetical protein